MATAFERPQDLLGKVEMPLGSSDWLLIDQARIDGFAEVTGDHQWIHVDPVRAAQGPFGATIAHGFLTLSLVNLFLPQILQIRQFSSGVNVGADRLRFVAPVKVGARIRGSGLLLRAEEVKGGAIQALLRITVEIEGEDKPACVVDKLSRYYP